ncbi:MAG TPA: ABC-F family ATP-binding cassette domain-containing protein [Trueperaceae bacterium]|nr:ABC-F family ATP-binding cassette domain-containing protein [Trueperaceae bacterium]
MSLQLRAVAKRYGDTTVFSDVNLKVGRGQKVALIGPNGSGKTTLLRIAAEVLAPDFGSVTAEGRVAYLEQSATAGEDGLLAALTPPELQSATTELTAAQAALEDPSAAALDRHAEAEERFRMLGGYDFAARVEAVLAGIGLSATGRVNELSGGQARRLGLARQLLAPADVYLLDEPTNHLDAAGLTWLEEWVRASKATMLIVSHDRDFLDATVSAVAELERGGMTVWPGTYTEAMSAKAAESANQLRLYEAQVRTKKRLEEEAARLASQSRSADKFNHKRAGNQALILAKAKSENVARTLARRAKALEARSDKLEVVAKPFEDGALPTIPLPEVPLGPTDVVRLSDVSVMRGGHTLVSGLDLLLRRGEKLAITGPNGSGKSSLLKTVLGELAPAAGTVTLGVDTPFVLTQDGSELSSFVSLEDAVRAAQPLLQRQDLHHLLARLGLPNDPNAPLATLSGGQRTRLALARLAVTRAPLLVLDEPTNHLDLKMVEALERLLVEYRGAVLLVSHDRRLVKAVAGRVMRLGGS